MNSDEITIQKLENQIANGKLKNTISDLLNVFDDYEYFYSSSNFNATKGDVILFSANLCELDRKILLGIITDESSRIERNKLTYGIIEVVKVIKANAQFNEFLKERKKLKLKETVIRFEEVDFDLFKLELDFSKIFKGVWENYYFLEKVWHTEYFRIESPNKYIILPNSNIVNEGFHAFNLQLINMEDKYIHLLKFSTRDPNFILKNTLYLSDNHRYIGLDFERKYQYTRIS